MGEHIVDGPLSMARWSVQSSLPHTCGKRGDGLRLFFELRQDLVYREGSVIHVDNVAFWSLAADR